MADATESPDLNLQEVEFRLNLGPNADLHMLAAVIADLAKVCELATALQIMFDENRTLARQYFYRRRSLETIYGLEPLWVPNISFEDVEGADERALDRARIRVGRLTYNNPLEWVLLIAVSAIAAKAILELVREWPERKRLNKSVATDYENVVLAREEARQIVLQKLRQSEISISLEQADKLLTADTLDALQALGNSKLDFSDLEDLK